MANWLKLAKDEIAKLPKRPTAITDNISLMSVLAVPLLSESGGLILPNVSNVSFGSTLPVLSDSFFNIVDKLGIQLLYDDKRWLNIICFGKSLTQLQLLLNQYIKHWLDAMDQETMVYKKQNAGRYKANCFLREALAAVNNR